MLVRFGQKLFLILVSLSLAVVVHAAAQLTGKSKAQIVATLSTKIKAAIAKRPEVPDLRDKVMYRLAECGLVYNFFAHKAPDAELREQFEEAKDVTSKVLIEVSMGVSEKRFDEILDVGLEAFKKGSQQDKHKQFLVLRSCKSFNTPTEIDDAVAELAL
jgi:hypothetical protein